MRTSILRLSAAQSVHEALRREIIEGRYAPGTRLYEPTLAATLAVSRTPLREALRSLEAEGFVERLPTGGVAVTGIDLEDVRQLWLVRAALEAVVVAEAARRASEADILKLNEILDRMNALTGHPSAVLELGAEFHERLIAISGNTRCRQLLEPIRLHLDRCWAITTAHHPDRPRVSVAEHRRIVEALARNDREAAEQAMKDHMERSAAISLETARLTLADREDRTEASSTHGG